MQIFHTPVTRTGQVEMNRRGEAICLCLIVNTNHWAWCAMGGSRTNSLSHQIFTVICFFFPSDERQSSARQINLAGCAHKMKCHLLSYVCETRNGCTSLQKSHYHIYEIYFVSVPCGFAQQQKAVHCQASCSGGRGQCVQYQYFALTSVPLQASFRPAYRQPETNFAGLD